MAATAKLELLLELKNKLKAGLGQAKSEALSNLKEMKEKLGGFATENLKAFASSTVLSTGLILGLGTSIAKATDIALDWERTLAKVNVTAGLGRSELAGLSNKILDIGAQGSTDLMQVPEAFNRIISAGLDVNTSLAALEPTLKAAKAGFADIETVAGAGIGVMKSSGQNINVVYDTLFATLNKGNAEFRDIAQYLPKIIPNSRLAGLQLYETAGAFAFLTAQGQTAEQSSVGLMNAFKALSDPKYTTGFKEIGVNVFNSKGEFRGLVPVVEDLQKAMKGLSTEQQAFKFKTIGLDQEARSAFGSMIQNASELKADIDFVKHSTGQLDLALKNSATSTDAWKSGFNKLTLLTIKWGQNFLPVLKDMGQSFNSFMDEFVRTDAQRANDAFKEQTVTLDTLKNELNPLLDRYDELTLKSSKTKTEQEELTKVINRIADVLPSAATGFDSLGNAMDINTSKARNFIGASADALKILNAEAIKGKQKEIEDIRSKISLNSNSLKGYLSAGIPDSSFKNEHIQSLRSNLKGLNEILGMRQSELDQLSGKTSGKALTPDKKEAALAGAGDVGLGGAAPTADPTAHQSKSITINIEALHKGNNLINAEGKGMTLSQFEKFFQEMALRTLRDIEASY